ncbi:Proline iminopeptidase [Chlamydia trachomatis]|nr:Proline iminopeptidase [Chlamydia trachomatis]
MLVNSYIQHSCTVNEHRFVVPLDHRKTLNAPASTPQTLETIEIFAREVIRPGGEDLPYLVYLQGGPGFGAPRSGDFRDGWLGHLLDDHRLILLDQRGTGQSGRLDARSLVESGRFDNPDGSINDQALADYLMLFRQDQIVWDAEHVRRELAGDAQWSTLGQSFGGFITTAYLSLAPEGLEKSLITGGLPGLTHVDEIYRRTYAATAKRNQTYFSRYASDERTIREIAAHLRDTEELLPTGERLSPARFRMIGMGLGTTTRTDMLHYLLEGPWTTVRGQRRLSHQFLEGIAAEIAGTPMYAVLHETIYAGATPDLAGTTTNWSADRLAEEIPGFAKDADPLDESEPYYLTGEHMMRRFFDEDPFLRPFAKACDILATRTDWPAVYIPEVLTQNTVPVAASVYYDDMFVPRELSLDTAATIRGARTWITNEYQHDGLRASGTNVIDHLFELVRD